MFARLLICAGWLALAAGCTDEMFAMRLSDDVRIRAGVPIVLDLTEVGGPASRADRLVLSADGQARRNRGGNLFTRTRLTDAEQHELTQLRESTARIDVAEHSSPHVAHPSAFVLRFDGEGNLEQPDVVRAFGARVLFRLAPDMLLQQHAVVVVAQVHERHADGRAQLRVSRVLKGTLPVGAPLFVHLPDGREGAGGEPTVFALDEDPAGGWRPSYVKIDEAAAVAALPR